jgi:hypothetical protein
MAQTIYILDPVAPFPASVDRRREQLDGLRGKVLGFIDNGKPNFAELVADLAELATSRYGAREVLTHAKRLGSSVPAGEPVYREFAARCDLVVTGSGD